MKNCKVSKTPLQQALNRVIVKQDDKVPKDMGNTTTKSYPYRSVVGSLQYLSNNTRPDITNTVRELSKCLENPDNTCISAAKRTLGYLKGTKSLGLTYDTTKFIWNTRASEVTNVINNLEFYSDASFAESSDRRSVTGTLISFLGTPLLWRSCCQSIIATSTAESELIALYDLGKMTKGLLLTVQDMFGQGDDYTGPEVCLCCDNQSTLRIVKNMRVSQRTKHLDLRFCWLHSQPFAYKYVRSEDQRADPLTKVCSQHKIMTLLGI